MLSRAVSIWVLSALFLVTLLAPIAAASPAPPKLHPTRWQRFRTGTVRPRGWLLQQAKRQANALTSHLPLFWKEIANTSWLGGGADNVGGIHESTPYWLNGAVPLAFQLEDPKLLALVERYIIGILDRQAADGWLGPDTDPSDFWSRYPFILALVQYHEAVSSSALIRKKIFQAALHFFSAVEERLARRVEFNSWSAARAHDLIWAIHYFVDILQSGANTDAHMELGERTRSLLSERLLRLAEQLHVLGIDWHGTWFGNASAFPQAAADHMELGTLTHGVNNAQAVKHGAVWARQGLDGNASFAQSLQAWEILMQYHGQPSGVFSADEHLAGRLPSRGTELCVVVESLWSLALVAQASPDDHQSLDVLDAMESIAFNALPGGISSDFWSHPYLQFANSFQARPNETDHIWANDGPDAAMYGLAPNYECCTSNFHQGYPKFIANLFFEAPSRGELISAIWAPSFINCSVGGGASVELRTDYPFSLNAEYIIHNPEALRLKIRLPEFLRQVAGPTRGLATLKVWLEGRETIVELVDGFLVYDIPAWPLPEPRVAIRLEWAALVQQTATSDGVLLSVGPLRLVADLGEQRVEMRRYAFEAADWDTTTTLEWRRALPPSEVIAFGPIARRLPGATPFAHTTGGCPLVVNATLASISPVTWPTVHGAPGPVPLPVAVHGVVFERRLLLPYGCTSVRIAAFPEADLVDGDRMVV